MSKLKKKVSQSRNRIISAGLPGVFGPVDQTFDSPQEMTRSLDEFLGVLYKIYKKDKNNGNTPSLFGFVIRELFVRKDAKVKESKITSDPGLGIAVITVPDISGESPEQWLKRQNEVLSIYFTTLPVAQIQAKVQLFRLLTEKGRKNLGLMAADDVEIFCQQGA